MCHKAVQYLCLRCLSAALFWLSAQAQPSATGAAPDPAPTAASWPDPSVPLVPLRSSAIRAIGYDPVTGQLFIDFVRGKHPYTYCAVPPELYEQLLHSPSPGTYYHQALRARYRCPPPAQ